MDLPRLGEALAPEDNQSATTASADRETIYTGSANDQFADFESLDNNPAYLQPAPDRHPGQVRSMAEPLPAWLRGDEDLLGEDDFDGIDADGEGESSAGLHGFRWIKKNISSFKVTVSLQRPLPPGPAKPRKHS